jgi:hypothetical protein
MRFLRTRGHNKEGEKEVSSLSRNDVGTGHHAECCVKRGLFKEVILR